MSSKHQNEAVGWKWNAIIQQALSHVVLWQIICCVQRRKWIKTTCILFIKWAPSDWLDTESLKISSVPLKWINFEMQSSWNFIETKQGIACLTTYRENELIKDYVFSLNVVAHWKLIVETVLMVWLKILRKVKFRLQLNWIKVFHALITL